MPSVLPLASLLLDPFLVLHAHGSMSLAAGCVKPMEALVRHVPSGRRERPLCYPLPSGLS